MTHTRDFGDPLPPGWSPLTDDRRRWDEFVDRFGFRPGVSADTWPAIAEPAPSMTFGLTTPAGARRAGSDAVNAEALRCFVAEFAADPTFLVFDWNHPSHRFDAAVHARDSDEWRVPVYPDGDYCVFVREDLTEGTFGHPWERTLCVFGDRLVASLGRTLAAWLPVVRIDGTPCGPT